jgi:hypothetical protein
MTSRGLEKASSKTAIASIATPIASDYSTLVLTPEYLSRIALAESNG